MRKLFLSLCMVLALVACKDEKKESTQADIKQVVKIGGLLPMTGGIAHIGEGAKNGALMAIEELNSMPNSKYKYEFICEDIGSSPSKTPAIYNKLVQIDKVAALTSFNTAVGKIVKPLAFKDKIIHISSAVDNTIGDNAFNYVNSYSIKETSERLVEYMKKNKMKTISLVAFNHLSTEAVLQTLESVLKANEIEILSINRFNMEQMDFKTEALKIKQENPDIVFMHLVEPSMSLFSKQLLDYGYAGKLSSFLLFIYSNNPELFNEQIMIDLRDGADDFNKAYFEKFGVQAQAASINTYDNVMLIGKFIEKFQIPGKINAEDMGEKMKEIIENYMSPRGKMSLDSGLIYTNTVVKTIKDGNPLIIED